MEKEEKLFKVRFSINVTYYFIIMSLGFVALTIINSGKELFHPIMSVVMIVGLVLSYKKEYYSLNLELNTLTKNALIGPLKKQYLFDKLVVRDDKLYRSLNGEEKNIPSSKFFCNSVDYQNLLKYVLENKINNTDN